MSVPGPSYRGSGDIHWLLFWPVAPAGNPYWSDATEAAETLIAACVRQLEEWGVTRQDAGGELPVHGVYGVPEQWPHIRELYQRAGFVPAGDTEVVYLARVDDLPRPGPPPLAGLSVRRSVGMNGTRLSAVLDGQVIGYIEVEIFDDGRAAAPPRRVGRRRQPPCRRGLPAARSRDLAAGAGGGLAAAGPGHPAAGLRLAGDRPRMAGTTRGTGLSWPRRTSPSSPGPGAAGPGTRAVPDAEAGELSAAARNLRTWPSSR